jgi:hypothetical protein
MITPIHTPQVVDPRQPVQPTHEVKPDRAAETAPVQKSGQVSRDQVTLRSAGQQADSDRDR